MATIDSQVAPDRVSRLAASAEERAFDALIGPHVSSAYRLAVIMLRDVDQAEDAVQEATLKAWPSLRWLRAEGRVKPWFMTIVANQCRSVLRGRWWSLVLLPQIEERTTAEPVAVAVNRTDLIRALRRLPPKHRAAVYLRYYEDMELDEVAATLRISTTAARSRIHRSLRRLRLTLDVEEPVK